MFKGVKRSMSLRGAGLRRNAGDELAPHGPNSTPVSGPVPHNASRLPVHAVLQNTVLSPVRFPGGKNPYLDRPLPVPPAPKISSTMPARPSTSSGPTSGKPMGLVGLPARPNINDKRLSKDDMFVSGRVGGSSKRGLQPYRVGVRGGLPTPEMSPNNPAAVLPPPPIIRAPSPASMTSGDIPIGMALGSPTHPPQPSTLSSWQSPPAPVQRWPLPAESQPVEPEVTVQRQKTQKRKLFGGLFGSRKGDQSGKSNQAASESGQSPTAGVTVTTSTTVQARNEAVPARSNTISERATPKYKPIIIRSNTVPSPNPSPLREQKSEVDFRGRGSDLSPREPARANYNEPPSVSAAPSLSVSGSLLDVEIPSIKLDRYSVMFGSLLNPEQNTSSLLARRQATLEKLKTINDKIVAEEEERERIRQRRATSPQPTKSPAFTLFPPTPGRHPAMPTTPRRLSPRTRSNTSPAMLPSPSKAQFDQNVPKKKTVTIVSPKTMERQAAIAARAEQEAHPGTRIDIHNNGFNFGPDESGLVLDSPQSMSSEEIIDSHPLKPAIVEPEWQMISPPSSSASSTTTKRSPSSSASSVQTVVTRPSVEIDEADNALKTAVELSIARQISISRQQRQMLRPLQTSIASQPSKVARTSPGMGSSPSSRGLSPVNKAALGKNERVAETKFSTPTLVVPKETLDSQLAQHRRSERVVLEAA